VYVRRLSISHVGYILLCVKSRLFIPYELLPVSVTVVSRLKACTKVYLTLPSSMEDGNIMKFKCLSVP